MGNADENVDANEMVDVLNDFLEPTIGAFEIKDDDIEQDIT